MARQFDATLKHLIEAHPADWLALAHLPIGSRVEVVDADISSIAAAADKVIRVDGPDPYIAHLEFQSGADADLDRRVLLYNVLLRHRHRVPVRSVVLLLRKEAQSTGATGVFREHSDADQFLEFGYRLVRVWEQSVDVFLNGGIGTLPLAPIGAVNADAVPEVLDRMQERLSVESTPQETRDSMAASLILAGLKYSPQVARKLFEGVRHMEESTTYQAIIEEGRAKGRAEGEAQGKAKEAKSILLRLGSKRFGLPSAEVRAVLDRTIDLPVIESLIERIVDVNSWSELLRDVQ